MTALTSRLVAAAVTTAILAVCPLLVEGCGSIACEETDTCPGVGSVDGATRDGAVRDSSEDAKKRRDARSTEEEATEDDGSDLDSPLDGELDSSIDVVSDSGAADATLADTSVDAPADASIDARPDVSTDAPAMDAPAMDAPADRATVDAPATPDAPADVATDTNDGCSSVKENCTNGIDDNCNGLIDCADPECMSQGFTCVPPWASSGWTGPTVLYDAFQAGGPAPTPLSCTGAGAYTQALPTAVSTRLGNYDPTAANPTCGCTCGSTVQGVTCPEPSVTGSTNMCPGGGTTVSATATATCSQLTASDDFNSFTVAQGAASGGSCPSNDTGLPVPSWNVATGWEGAGSACTTGRAASSYFSGAQGGCTGTEVCVEPLPGAFNGGAACVFLSGKATCPTGYSTEHDYFTGANDTRSCEYTCTCTPTGVACTADLTVSNQSTCTGGMTMTDLSIGCTSVSDYSPVWMEATVASTGSCTFAAGAVAGGAAATGSVTPTGQVTVCCDK
jgi:hypothetical protein